ncbi:MAG: hypothetical protein FWG72_10980 [Oscillospiraceae bacterium]|nr:hypothetical protein [Oscillospiraceae bacterium]
MQTSKRRIFFAIFAFFLSSMTVWFMPMASFEQKESITFAYILAAIFWLGLVLGIVFQLLVSRTRKRDSNYKDEKGLPLLRFFSNRPAKFFDALLIAGVVTLAASFFIGSFPQWLTTAAIFASAFGFEMHGVFNGKNYKYTREARRGCSPRA